MFIALQYVSTVVLPTLLYMNAETTKFPAKGHKWLSLRRLRPAYCWLFRNPSERFQASPNRVSSEGRSDWNDNHKERDLRRTTQRNQEGGSRSPHLMWGQVCAKVLLQATVIYPSFFSPSFVFASSTNGDPGNLRVSSLYFAFASSFLPSFSSILPSSISA